MIRSIYLVTRRDYLGYVSAWGFWLGLILTPLILGAFMFAQVAAETSEPTRYFSILDDHGGFVDAFDQSISEREAVQKRQATEMAEAVGAPAELATKAVEERRPKFVRIAPPVTSIEALRPYLRGEKLVDTDQGPKPLFAVIYIPKGGGDIQYWSENLQSKSLINLATRAERFLVETEVLAKAGVSRDILNVVRQQRRAVVQQKTRAETETSDSKVTLADQAPYFMSIAMAFSLWFLIFSVINYLLMGTIEERSNKIFDTLLTSVKLPHLLAGKLLAVLLLSFTLMAFWGGLSTLIGFSAGSMLPSGATDGLNVFLSAALSPTLIIPAVISFIFGYLMYGSMFLALGALCDTIQEAQTLMTPLFVLLMTPLAMLAFAANDAESALVEGMSWVPFFTPFLLILRMPTEPPLWEVLAQITLMVSVTLLILWGATRVYRAGAVHGSGVNDIGGVLKGLFSRSAPQA